MTLRDFEKVNDWMFTRWQTTYRNSWDGILCLANAMGPHMEKVQVLVKEFPSSAEEIDVTEQVATAEDHLKTLRGKEKGVLVYRGMSKILKCPMQIVFYNQTNVCEVSIPFSFLKDFDKEENKYQKLACELGSLMDSMEILGHVGLSKLKEE